MDFEEKFAKTETVQWDWNFIINLIKIFSEAYSHTNSPNSQHQIEVTEFKNSLYELRTYTGTTPVFFYSVTDFQT